MIIHLKNWRTIAYLRKHYTDVYLPSFDSQDMVKNNPIMMSKTKRCMNRLRHYTFKQRLLNTKNLNVHIVNEAYTSKTCTRCGCLNSKLGNKKTFDCHMCGLLIDRDINGARNIYI